MLERRRHRGSEYDLVTTLGRFWGSTSGIRMHSLSNRTLCSADASSATTEMSERLVVATVAVDVEEVEVIAVGEEERSSCSYRWYDADSRQGLVEVQVPHLYFYGNHAKIRPSLAPSYQKRALSE